MDIHLTFEQKLFGSNLVESFLSLVFNHFTLSGQKDV